MTLADKVLMRCLGKFVLTIGVSGAVLSYPMMNDIVVHTHHKCFPPPLMAVAGVNRFESH